MSEYFINLQNETNYYYKKKNDPRQNTIQFFCSFLPFVYYVIASKRIFNIFFLLFIVFSKVLKHSLTLHFYWGDPNFSYCKQKSYIFRRNIVDIYANIVY